jgi:hypothetical protein
MFQNVQLSNAVQLSSLGNDPSQGVSAYLALVLQQVMRKERIGWTRLQQEPSAQVDTWFTNEERLIRCHGGWDFLVISWKLDHGYTPNEIAI